MGAVAQNINTLIGANVLGGLAGAVQISFTVAIAELVPNKHRPLWVVGIFASSFEFAAFGPVVAQALVIGTAPGWRVNYFINIAVAGMAVILFFFFCTCRQTFPSAAADYFQIIHPIFNYCMRIGLVWSNSNGKTALVLSSSLLV
jgi:MFS family permease